MTASATLLNPGQVERVHEASLEILEDVGVLVHNQEARARFAKHGCRVDAETQVVKFPRAVVEEFRAAIPPTFTFHGRDPRYDRTIPTDGPLFVTGSSAPNVIDILTRDNPAVFARRGRADSGRVQGPGRRRRHSVTNHRLHRFH